MSARDRRDKAEMRTEDVLTSRPTVLTEAQRAAYFSDGFLILPDYVPRTWLERLCAANDELLERSRRVVHPDSIFVLEERHSAQHPRLHRVSSPQDQHPTFWDFMCDPIMTDLAADVVGPDVKFHHAKLNVKSERGHTRVQVASGHPDEVAASIPADMVATATGGPGTTVLLNCRTIHGSGENRSDRARPLLLPGLFLGRFISLYSQSDCQPASWRHCARAPSALRLLRHASVRATSRLPRWIQSSLVGSARRGEQSWHSVEDVGDTTGTIQTDLSCAARGAVADYSGLRIAEMVRLPTQALFIS
jgi:ectoine hydroxylase